MIKTNENNLSNRNNQNDINPFSSPQWGLSLSSLVSLGSPHYFFDEIRKENMMSTEMEQAVMRVVAKTAARMKFQKLVEATITPKEAAIFAAGEVAAKLLSNAKKAATEAAEKAVCEATSVIGNEVNPHRPFRSRKAGRNSRRGGMSQLVFSVCNEFKNREKGKS